MINFGLVGDIRKTSKISRTVYNYRKANFQGLKLAIRNANLADIVNQCGHNIDNACNLWTSKLLEVINRFIPSYEIKNINSPPWIDGDVIHMSNKKETAHRKSLRCDTPEAWSRYKVLRNKVKKNLENSKYNNFIKESSQDISFNPKRFWSLFRAKTKSKNIPEKVYFDTSYAHTPIRKAFLFNSFFQANFTLPGDTSHLPQINGLANPNLESCQISITETRLIIDNIDTNKASGRDNISGRTLKECSREISPSLTVLFNVSLTLGKMPENWKLANISQFFKKRGQRKLLQLSTYITPMYCKQGVGTRCIEPNQI